MVVLLELHASTTKNTPITLASFIRPSSSKAPSPTLYPLGEPANRGRERRAITEGSTGTGSRPRSPSRFDAQGVL